MGALSHINENFVYLISSCTLWEFILLWCMQPVTSFEHYLHIFFFVVFNCNISEPVAIIMNSTVCLLIQFPRPATCMHNVNLHLVVQWVCFVMKVITCTTIMWPSHYRAGSSKLNMPKNFNLTFCTYLYSKSLIKG